ncbi:ABC transporter substrate-binding protein [Leucobacter sp. Psy1]|uniref:ABC transporter substrate-binding protein n=1 Tax=Leucobacter sp. Psy1 TaxID=2875729 RepID=UPI001CD3A189|nr:ABC transporter substrate-binding protein [Leucobacter sp. Psy1]UBH07435.1 ABC transporter substrate-binding protein [Leucobacter sp. Psy1]
MNTKFGRRVATACALTAGGALVLTGCFSGGSGGGASSDDARISVAMLQPPNAGMSPFSDDIGKLTRLSIAETLVNLNEDLEIEPMLATEWEQTDDTTWVFTLRENVVFQDGTPFTAETVKNSLDKAVAAAPPPRALNGVEISTEVTGEHEITITTDAPDALIPNRLASGQLSMFAESAYGDDGTVNPAGTGTGPFVLTELNGTTTATLDRFEDYWDDPAILAGIDVSFVPDGAARAAAIRSGEADVAETIPVSQVSLLEEDQVHEVEMPRTTMLALNNSDGPFADPAVRAAARKAIDASGIIDSVYEGQADFSGGLLGPAIPWAADLRGDVASDVEPAKVDGVPITIATYSDRAENPEILVQLESQLEAAGFEVTQDVREYISMETEMLDGSFDAVVYSRGTLLDTGDPLSFLAADFSCEGGYNMAQLCDENVDAIIERGSQAEAGPERQEATMDAETAILRQNAVIPIVNERVVQAETGTFVDIVRDPLERRLISTETKPAE